MSSFRFSLAGLIGVVVALACGLAALRSATPIWAAAVFNLTLILLLIAVLGAAFSRGTRRVFWGGFAVFGWAYLALALGPGLATQVSPHLLTTRLLTAMQSLLPQFQFRVNDKVLVQWGSSWWRCTVLQVNNGQYLIHYEGYSSASDEWVGPSRIKVGEPEHFFRIGHSLFGILFGLAGGALAIRMTVQRRRPPRRSSDSNLDSSTLQNSSREANVVPAPADS